LRDVTKSVPSPQGGTVYEVWRKATQSGSDTFNPQETSGSTFRPPAAQAHTDVSVGDLGSGSDYTVFLQHLGVPSTDVGSTGSYGVYHSVFDNFNWFKKFGDPNFLYEQEMARIYGLEALRMANADVLPFDYEEYGKEILAYLDAAKKKAEAKFGTQSPDFGPAGDAAKHFEEAGAKVLAKERKPPEDTTKLNHALRDAERALLLPEGLPNRPWYKHAIYAPGQYTGYAAVVIPGVNEGIEAGDLERTKKQIAVLAQALQKATHVLESYH
jgi:N-acetylated-alpha-linked acidic dipeptidase